MVFEGGALERQLGQEGGTLMNGISGLIKRDTRKMTLTEQEGSHLQARKGALTRN